LSVLVKDDGQVRGVLDPIILVFRNRRLRRLQGAWAASMLGGCAYTIALSVVAFRSGGATAVGLILLARMAASAISSPLLAPLADRYSRPLVMSASDALRAAITLAMGVLVEANAPAMGVYVLAVVNSAVGTAFRPAQAALMPSLATTPEELTAANAVSGTIESAGYFAGPGIGGLILVVAGTGAVFGACVAAFVVSGVLALSVRGPAVAAEEGDQQSGAAPQPAMHGGMFTGFTLIGSTPALLAVTITYAAQAMVAGALGVFAVVLAINVLGLGPPGVGYLDSAFGVGGILGGAAAAALAGTRRLAAAFAIGVVMWGIGVALLGATASTLVAILVMAGVGAGNTVLDVSAITLLQRSAPDEVLGRVFGVLESVLLGSVGAGSALAPAAIHVFGVRDAMILTGVALPVVVVSSSRWLVRLDRLEPEVAAAIDLLRAHRIFAPLNESTLEQLARRLEPLALAPDAEVIRQGDRGDRVYIVVAGRLAVDVDGRPGAPLGAGDVFGEIALLHDVPRTASVRTLTDVQLQTLGRDEFLAAVTGHPGSAAEAAVVVSARLGALRPGVVAT
jgi:MFS family permease